MNSQKPDTPSESSHMTPQADQWIKRDQKHVWHGFTQTSTYAENGPVIVESGEGNWLIDVDGNRYLDAISSVWLNTLGHNVPELDTALRNQLDRIAHSTMLGNGNRIVIELAEALAAVVPIEDPYLLFASDGSAAVEQATKIAFQYWQNLGSREKVSFLAISGAYHGDTIGSLSLGSDEFGSNLFEPLQFEVIRAPGYDHPDWELTAISLVSKHHEKIAAAVIEPLVQGASGMHTTDPNAIKAFADACSKHGVLLICDEVATGFGRTGTLFASEQCGIQPDLMCLGKGITGGYLPMSATVAAGHIHQAFLGQDLGPEMLYHGHSYGGNALAAAVALRHLSLITESNVLSNVQKQAVDLSQLLKKRIACIPGIAQIRCLGLLAGIELEASLPPLTARKVCTSAVSKGILLRSIGPVITIVPPLSITSEELKLIISVLEETLREELTLSKERTATWVLQITPSPCQASGNRLQKQ